MVEFNVQDFYDFVMKAEKNNREYIKTIGDNIYEHFCYSLKEGMSAFSNSTMDNALYNLLMHNCHYVFDIYSDQIIYKIMFFDKKQIENTINLDCYDSESKEGFAFQLSVSYDFPFSTEDYILMLKIVDKLRLNERNFK
ncbi:hypothetical protein ACQ27_gp288 [Klebsiella phage K64-1]|uniref:hypothetical protein n=1 Tax=Klebsiella phage K64-1 TaxID=1439894 RepID=UPI00248B8B0A|nr:hypothetical protein ACQ27_gp288 [Klebsiella phage K64-1]